MFLLIKPILSFNRVIKLPENSALSKASILPPLLSVPFHLVQNTREFKTGESSANKAPVFVSFPELSRKQNESKNFSDILSFVHDLYLSLSFEKE